MVVLATNLRLSDVTDVYPAATISAKPRNLVALLNVHLNLQFLTTDPTLDLKLKHVLTQLLRKNMQTKQLAYQLTQLPNIRVEISYAPPLATALTEVRRNFIYFLLRRLS